MRAQNPDLRRKPCIDSPLRVFGRTDAAPEAEAPLTRRVTIFSIVFVTTTALTTYTLTQSDRLSDFRDALLDERLSVWQKVKSLASVWRAKGDWHPPSESFESRL